MGDFEMIEDDVTWQRIKEITLANFKGIGSKPVTIPIRNITLLFGENSAGKSTILHSMFYACKVLENFDERKLPGEESLDLGDFKNLVHNHDTSRKILLEFKMDIDCDGLAVEEPVLDMNEFELTVSMQIAFHPVFNSVIVERYSIDFDRQTVACCIIESEEKSYLDLSHPCFSELEDKEKFLQFCSKYQNLFTVEGQKIYYTKLGEHSYTGFGFPSVSKEDRNLFQKFEAFYQQLHSGSLSSLREYLSRERVAYIGPYRALPPRDFQTQSKELSWYNGMRAWQQIHYSTRISEDGSVNNGWINYVNEYLEILGLKYRLDLDEDNSSKQQNVIIRDLDKKLKLSLYDIGFGVSQVIPVVVGIADEDYRLLAVEQPELHLHPALQGRLADVVIHDLNSKCYKNFIFETHSEHLILRILRRIRETAEDFGSCPYPLQPNDVSCLYIYSENGETKIEELPIDEDGEFTKDWPNGFFEERVEDLF